MRYLRSKGFETRLTERIRAEKGVKVLWIDGLGLAWASFDMLDIMAPLIPLITEVEKQHLLFQQSSNPYYTIKHDGSESIIRFSPRMESLATWRELRSTGISGLSPDEALAIKYVLGLASGRITAVTDYPCENSRELQIGAKLFYNSVLEISEFLSNLSAISETRRRNTYLPRNPVLRVTELRSPDKNALAEFSTMFGEWCYFSFT
jgi:hypothetical protein